MITRPVKALLIIACACVCWNPLPAQGQAGYRTARSPSVQQGLTIEKAEHVINATYGGAGDEMHGTVVLFNRGARAISQVQVVVSVGHEVITQSAGPLGPGERKATEWSYYKLAHGRGPGAVLVAVHYSLLGQKKTTTTQSRQAQGPSRPPLPGGRPKGY